MKTQISPKEYKAILMCGRGMSYKQIAAEWGTTEQVIKNLLRIARERVGARTTVQLAVMVFVQRERQMFASAPAAQQKQAA